MNREQWKAVWRWMRMEKRRLEELHNPHPRYDVYCFQFTGYWCFRGQ